MCLGASAASPLSATDPDGSHEETKATKVGRGIRLGGGGGVSLAMAQRKEAASDDGWRSHRQGRRPESHRKGRRSASGGAQSRRSASGGTRRGKGRMLSLWVFINLRNLSFVSFFFASRRRRIFGPPSAGVPSSRGSISDRLRAQFIRARSASEWVDFQAGNSGPGIHGNSVCLGASAASPLSATDPDGSHEETKATKVGRGIRLGGGGGVSLAMAQRKEAASDDGWRSHRKGR